MKRISRKSHLKLWFVGIALLLLVLCRHSAEAQSTNTFPSTGSAGIGTTSPTAPFTISTAGNTVDGSYYSTMTIRKTGDTFTGIRFDKNSTALFRLGTDTSNNFQISRFAGAGSPDDGAFYIDQSGNVGIGTTTPAARLNVQGTGYFSSVLSLGHATSFARLGQNLSVTNAANYGGMVLSTFSAVNADQGPVMDFSRSRSSTIGTYTAVANDDMLGHIIFRGSTGSAFGDFARISGQVDGATIAGGDTPGRLVFWTTPDGSGSLLERMRIDSGGNIGIGTASPNTNLVGTYSYPAAVKVAQIDSTQARLVVRGSFDSGIDLISTNAAVKWMQLYNYAGVTKFRSVDDSANFKADNVVAMDNSTGNVGIGTAPTSYRLDVNGNTNVTGSFNASGTITGGAINAKYQDVAEWVESSQALGPGTVVVLDETSSNQVIASSQAYDTRVAGVISLQPGITLGEKGENKVLVATTGRVRVKVSAAGSPIRIGDLLVTSDVPGLAMKSEPITISGRQIHSPGTLIGKAIEPLEKGTGEILVLLSLQ